MIAASALILATFVEGLTEYIFGNIERLKPYLMYIALVFGVIACVVYKVDILAELGLTTTIPYVGSIFSGLIIGRGSNYVNDFISAVKAPPEKVG